MKIQMIGTGSMISKDNPACYLIDNKIMIDMPNGIVKELKKKDLFEDVKYIFITHMHGDHIFDLPFIFLDRLKTKKDLTIYISEMWFKKIKKLVKLAFPSKYYEIFSSSNIHFLTNSKSIQIDDLTITSFKVSHGVMRPAFGYSVFSADKKVVFSGDTSLCSSLIDELCDANYLICDCTLTKGDSKHMGIDNIKTLLTDFQQLKIIPSHMGINAKNGLQKVKEKHLIIKEDFSKIIV